MLPRQQRAALLCFPVPATAPPTPVAAALLVRAGARAPPSSAPPVTPPTPAAVALLACTGPALVPLGAAPAPLQLAAGTHPSSAIVLCSACGSCCVEWRGQWFLQLSSRLARALLPPRSALLQPRYSSPRAPTHPLLQSCAPPAGAAALSGKDNGFRRSPPGCPTIWHCQGVPHPAAAVPLLLGVLTPTTGAPLAGALAFGAPPLLGDDTARPWCLPAAVVGPPLLGGPGGLPSYSRDRCRSSCWECCCGATRADAVATGMPADVAASVVAGAAPSAADLASAARMSAARDVCKWLGMLPLPSPTPFVPLRPLLLPSDRAGVAECRRE